MGEATKIFICNIKILCINLFLWDNFFDLQNIFLKICQTLLKTSVNLFSVKMLENIFSEKIKLEDILAIELTVHSEKRFDWFKQNNLFERLFLIKKEDLFRLNKLSKSESVKIYWLSVKFDRFE